MNSERDSNGRFAHGNPGGPGRLKREVEANYLAEIGECISLADWREICRRAAADAKAGDAKSRDWVSKYLVGDKPLEICPEADRIVRVHVPSNGRYQAPGSSGTLPPA